MAKNNRPQAENEQKVVTRYDRKMEERRKKEAKEKHDEKLMRIGAIIVCIGIVAAIAASVTVSVLNKNAALKNTYVTVGDHALTKLEYDYYYHTVSNNYVNTYGSFLSYMGLDTTRPYDEQQYTDTMTWKDMFDQMAVEQIQQTKALVDGAAENSFSYDAAEDYAGLLSSISASADTAGVTLSDYYKSTYGNYATERNMEPFIKEGLLAAAYYDELLTQNKPTDKEIDDYYAENVQNYDKVDYRSFLLKADVTEDASEEDTASAMADISRKANAMKEEREGGADFKELCIKYAAEEEKVAYEDEEADASLSEGAYYSSAPSAIADWLYEDGRTKGDITVIEDEVNHQYYVVEFIDRYYDEADDVNISNTIASDRTAEYIAELVEGYTVTDHAGELKYLTIDPSADNGEEAPAEEGQTEESAEDTSGENQTEEGAEAAEEIPESTE